MQNTFFSAADSLSGLTEQIISAIINQTENGRDYVTINDDEALIAAAEMAMEKAYALYSHFKVGAAILCADGEIFTGCNVENSSYGAACCAERTAVFKAVSEGCVNFVTIAIVSSDCGETFPCGICRQVLSEFSPNISVILKDKNGTINEYTLDRLLPHSFRLDK